MKKLTYLFSILFLSATFLITSCSDKKDDKTEDKKDPLMEDCISRILKEMDADPMPEELESMDFPSNKEMATCICEKYFDKNSDVTEEDLNDFIDAEDIDLNEEEIEERMTWTAQCAGYNSLEEMWEEMMKIRRLN